MLCVPSFLNIGTAFILIVLTIIIFFVFVCNNMPVNIRKICPVKLLNCSTMLSDKRVCVDLNYLLDSSIKYLYLAGYYSIFL